MRLLGVKEIKSIVSYDREGNGYFKLDEKNSICEGLSSNLIPSTGYAVDVVPEQSAEISAAFLKPMGGRYAALPEEGFPGIVTNKYKKGNSIYITGTMGEFYYSKANPDYRKLTSFLSKEYSTPLLKTDAPGSIDITLRKQSHPDRMIIHLTNMTGEMSRPFERVIPLYDVNISVRIDGEIKTVRDLKRGQMMDAIVEDGWLKLSMPEIKIYEVVAVDFA